MISSWSGSFEEQEEGSSAKHSEILDRNLLEIFMDFYPAEEAEEIPILDWGEKHYHALFVT